MSGRVDLHLRIRVSRENRAAFDAFLREAIPFYEAPGGIQVRLVEEEGDPTRLIEIVEYASAMTYLADRERVKSDPAMARYLERWRTLLDGPPVVEVYYEQGAATRAAGPDHTIGEVELRTKRLVLRPFRPADAETVMTLAGDRRVAVMTLTVPHPYELHHAKGWIESLRAHRVAGTAAVMAVSEKSERLVGAIGLEINRTHDRADLGYWIGVPYWGKGYATEAAVEMIRYGFETLNLNRINSCHFACNPASGRVLDKAGLRHEGYSPQQVKRFGEYQDVVMFGLGRAEWKAAREGKGEGGSGRAEVKAEVGPWR